MKRARVVLKRPRAVPGVFSRGPTITCHEVGTLRGWRWHLKTGVMACRPCLHAHAVDQEHYRNWGRCAPGLGWPL